MLFSFKAEVILDFVSLLTFKGVKSFGFFNFKGVGLLWVSSIISRRCPLERLSISRGVSSGVFCFQGGGSSGVPSNFSGEESFGFPFNFKRVGVLRIPFNFQGGSSAFPFNFKMGKVGSSGLPFNLGG